MDLKSKQNLCGYGSRDKNADPRYGFRGKNAVPSYGFRDKNADSRYGSREKHADNRYGSREKKFRSQILYGSRDKIQIQDKDLGKKMRIPDTDR